MEKDTKRMSALVSRNWLNSPFIISCPRSGARNIKKKWMTILYNKPDVFGRQISRPEVAYNP